MGQCYSVTGKIKYDNVSALSNALISAMNNQDCEWHRDRFPTDIKELLSMFLYDISTEFKILKNGSYELSFNSSFNQSYSWESLMAEIFEDISNVLRDGSYLTIYPDNNYDRYVIKNGKCVQTH